MLTRVLEPEVMDSLEEAESYDQMDHESVNRQFVSDLLVAPVCGKVLDLGTGTARIAIELCRQQDNCQVLAMDAATNMLEIARLNVAVAGFEYCIELRQGDAKSIPLNNDTCDLVISNSLIHHLPEPSISLAEMLRVLRPGGRLFVRDLLRPESAEQVEHLVRLYCCEEPESNQQLLRQSLFAALDLREIQEMAQALGFPTECVTITSDRHWTLDAVKQS